MAVDRILIVEDEEAILMALEDDLRLEGYEVECFRRFRFIEWARPRSCCGRS